MNKSQAEISVVVRRSGHGLGVQNQHVSGVGEEGIILEDPITKDVSPQLCVSRAGWIWPGEVPAPVICRFCSTGVTLTPFRSWMLHPRQAGLDLIPECSGL